MYKRVSFVWRRVRVLLRFTGRPVLEIVNCPRVFIVRALYPPCTPRPRLRAVCTCFSPVVFRLGFAFIHYNNNSNIIIIIISVRIIFISFPVGPICRRRRFRGDRWTCCRHTWPTTGARTTFLREQNEDKSRAANGRSPGGRLPRYNIPRGNKNMVRKTARSVSEWAGARARARGLNLIFSLSPR